VCGCGSADLILIGAQSKKIVSGLRAESIPPMISTELLIGP
jgi:hypothetical protein